MISIRTAIALGALVSSAAFAQQYPTRPVKMVLPIPAGSLTDIVGRAVAQGVAQAWGQPVVGETRAGANGTLGMEECARSAPDGYTVCMTDGNIMTINPYAYAKLPYDPLAFVPVIHLADLEVAFVVKSSIPVNSMKELVEYAKTRPNQLTWGTTGAGSTPHMYLEWFRAKTGAQFTHVPYKGPAQLALALSAGEIDMSNASAATLNQGIKDGKLRLIAVATGKKRSAYIGSTPSFAEQGFDIDFRNWLAMVMPPKAPMELARRWNAEVNRLLANAAFVEKVMTAQALTATGGSPEDLAATLEVKRRLGAELTRIANLKYD
jgi:tripartite-type tricarboxylate transporter receptor subunit TctC